MLSAKLRVPEPSVLMTCPELPSLVGKVSPDAVNAPDTNGAAVIVKLPLDAPVKLPVPL